MVMYTLAHNHRIKTRTKNLDEQQYCANGFSPVQALVCIFDYPSIALGCLLFSSPQAAYADESEGDISLEPLAVSSVTVKPAKALLNPASPDRSFTVTVSGTMTVTVTSNEDPSKSAVATITVQNRPLISSVELQYNPSAFIANPYTTGRELSNLVQMYAKTVSPNCYVDFSNNNHFSHVCYWTDKGYVLRA